MRAYRQPMRFAAAMLALTTSLLANPLPLRAQATPTPPPSPPPLTASPAPSPSITPAASPAPSPSAGVLTVQPNVLNLHPGEAQTVAVQSAAAPITATLDNPIATTAVVNANVDVTATQQIGRATLTITDASGASVQVPVRVANDAGTVPAAIALQVTGNPIDSTWLQTQIQRAVNANIQLQPGAVARLQPITMPQTLSEGGSAAIPVGVQITGGDRYYDVDTTASVAVQDVPTQPYEPSLLFYDDDPEKIVQNGLLYRNSVTAAAPARLYYYHQNTGDQRRLLVVLNATQPSRVQLIDASAGPNADVMSVGHAVTRDFLLQKPRNQGLVVDLSGSPYVARNFLMNPIDGAAGSVGVRVLSGGPVDVAVVAVPPGVTDADVQAAIAQPRLPGDGHHRTGTFTLAGYGQSTIAYSVGGPDASVDYGATTPPAADPAAGHDYGDYGVWRTIVFDAANPSGQQSTLYLYERPMGGAVRSSFLVNGTLVQLGCARVSNRYQIGMPFFLPAGQKTTIRIDTMTDGGSNYPLEIGLTTTPPQPSTPPISAPDGCFPKPQPTAIPSPGASPMPSPGPPSSPAPIPEPTG